jgi:hypothetical protein
MSLPAPAGGGHGDIAGRLADPLLAASIDDGDIVVSAKDRYWVPSDEKEILARQDCAAGTPPLLYRTFRVKGFLINLYRCVSHLCSAFLFKYQTVELRKSKCMECASHTQTKIHRVGLSLKFTQCLLEFDAQ